MLRQLQQWKQHLTVLDSRCCVLAVAAGCLQGAAAAAGSKGAAGAGC
jgi:hypothetical protein